MSQTEISDGKIHILYLVKNAPGVSYQMLMDKCLESLYLDFFNFSRCYNELIAGNLLDRKIVDDGTGEVLGSNEIIRITRGGEAILEDVEDSLNLQTLGYLRKASEELRLKVSEANEIKAFRKPSEKGAGYEVTLISTRDGIDFSCRINVPTAEEADTIISSWRSRNSEIYGKLVDELLKSKTE